MRHPGRVLDQALDAAERLGEQEQLRPAADRDGLGLGLDEERDHAAEVAHLARARSRGPGATAARGRGRARPPAAPRGTPRSRRAFSQCWRIRTASVFSPRRTSHESNGPGTAPSDFCRKYSRSASAGSFVATKPPTTSEWPPRYFVVECTTRSAPSESGCWRYGVANVLSTASSAPAACAASAARRMSTTLRSGFDGVSTQTSRTSSPRCEASLSSNSLGRDVREAVALRLVDLRGHPVDAAVHVGDQDDALARIDEVHDRVVAPSPDANAIPCAAPSRLASASCKRGPRRVRAARVVVALVLADRVLHEGRRLVDRRDRGPGRRVRVLPDVDRARLELHRGDATGRPKEPLAEPARSRRRMSRCSTAGDEAMMARRYPRRAERSGGCSQMGKRRRWRVMQAGSTPVSTSICAATADDRAGWAARPADS